MGKKYSFLVEEVKRLSTEEKEELKFLIEKYLIEERRAEMLKNYQESKREVEEGHLKFSNDVEWLKEKL